MEGMAKQAFYDDRSIRAHVNHAKELFSLTLQLDTHTEEAAKAVPELDDPCFMEDTTGLLDKLVSFPSKEIRCVERIAFSSFNPPPSYRRLEGDLLYLDVSTLEKVDYVITGSTIGFFVNSSNEIPPSGSVNQIKATTLVCLLKKISPKFKKAYDHILELKTAHPLKTSQPMRIPNSWLEHHVPKPVMDAAREEDALTHSYARVLSGMQRDWNVELQSCRELPRTSLTERILRDRAIYEVTSEFVNAAISGAVGVINKAILPSDPKTPEHNRLYLHNNIMFESVIDADFGLLIKSITSKNTDAFLNSQVAEKDQHTYASVNNELQGIKAYQEADVSRLCHLLMAVIDYKGHRVVAKSSWPGGVQGCGDNILYGSRGNEVHSNKSFHSKVLEAARQLHLKEHRVFDKSNKRTVNIAAPVECQGIVGDDERHYLLSIMRATPHDPNYIGKRSGFCVLRPELVTAFCEYKANATERSKSNSTPGKTHEVDTEPSKSDIEVSAETTSVALDSGDTTDVAKPIVNHECNSAQSESSASSDEILLNPNFFTEFELGGSEAKADKHLLREAAKYLRRHALKKFAHDLHTLKVPPMDGQTLTEALHARGINVRYIGRLINFTKDLPYISDLCKMEIIVRCAKLILKDVLRDSQDGDLRSPIAHFLNCLFGHTKPIDTKGVTLGRQSISDNQGRAKGSLNKGTSVKTSQRSYKKINPDSLWFIIGKFAELKYEFKLTEESRQLVKNISAIRNLCGKVGIQVKARDYDLCSTLPFKESDILNLQPVVKHSVHISSEARDLMKKGKVLLEKGELDTAYRLFSGAFSILWQVTGPMHREVADCCRYLAMVLYQAGKMTEAIKQQHNELIINVKCLGLDHPATALSHCNIARFYHLNDTPTHALHHMSKALRLFRVSCGLNHPDVAATFINVAVMYTDFGKVKTTFHYLQEALRKTLSLLGEEHIQTAVCHHALAIAFDRIKIFKLAHQHEKKTNQILEKQLGKVDIRTRASTLFIDRLDSNVKTRPKLPSDFKSAAAGGSTHAGATAKEPIGSATMGENLEPHVTSSQLTQPWGIITCGLSSETETITSDEPKNETTLSNEQG